MRDGKEKELEGQNEPEDILQEVGKEVDNLKSNIVEKAFDASIQPEQSDLDELQNTIVGNIVGNIEQNEGDAIEKEKTIEEAKKGIANIKKQTEAAYQAKNMTEEIVPLEIIRKNQTRSRKNVENILVPNAGMPERLVNKLDIS